MAPPEHRDAAESAAAKVATGQPLTPRESFALEAIIIPDKRPAIDIVNGDYAVAHPDWTELNDAAIKAIVKRCLCLDRAHRTARSSGSALRRHRLRRRPGPGDDQPSRGRDVLRRPRYARMVFRSGSRAGIDFLQAKGGTASQFLRVRAVAMIHPYWDMALLRVDGLDDGHPVLVLSLEEASDTAAGRRVAVIGYPAFDPRNDAEVQNRVFHGVYNAKRLQPGLLRRRRPIQSFGKERWPRRRTTARRWGAIRVRRCSIRKPAPCRRCISAASISSETTRCRRMLISPRTGG